MWFKKLFTKSESTQSAHDAAMDLLLDNNESRKNVQMMAEQLYLNNNSMNWKELHELGRAYDEGYKHAESDIIDWINQHAYSDISWVEIQEALNRGDHREV